MDHIQKTRRWVMAGAVTAGAALLFAQVAPFSAQAEVRSLALAGFSELSARAGMDVRVNVGPEFLIEMEGIADAIDTVDIHLEGAVLVVDRKRGWRETLFSWSRDEQKVTVNVALPELDAVAADAGASVVVSGMIERALRGKADAGASLDLTGIEGAALEIVASAGASVRASGTCTDVNARAGAGASVNLDGLDCATAVAEVSGGASMAVRAHETLSLRASGGGRLTAKGGGAVLRQEAGSGGSIRVRP